MGEEHPREQGCVAEDRSRHAACVHVGEVAKDIAQGYGSGAQDFITKQDLLDVLMKEVREDATYLVKGSRSSAMETVVEEMLKQKVVA